MGSDAGYPAAGEIPDDVAERALARSKQQLTARHRPRRSPSPPRSSSRRTRPPWTASPGFSAAPRDAGLLRIPIPRSRRADHPDLQRPQAAHIARQRRARSAGRSAVIKTPSGCVVVTVTQPCDSGPAVCLCIGAVHANIRICRDPGVFRLAGVLPVVPRRVMIGARRRGRESPGLARPGRPRAGAQQPSYGAQALVPDCAYSFAKA